MIYASNVEAVTRYAKSDGTGSGPCLTWATACTLTNALTQAATGDEIWVKSGAYGPFTLKNGVKTIGGFAGTESLASQSDPTTNQTVIDGRVIGTDNPASTVLRGFTIRNGNGGADGVGGGMILNNSNALIVQCIFEDNTANDFGGAVAIRSGGSPQFINCTFRNNGQGAANPAETNGGGAVFVREGAPSFVNCLFTNNKAWEGGVVMMVSGTPTFVNCTVVNNQATIGYGGVFFDPEGRATFRNCVLRSNTTTKGVGRYDQGYSGSGGTTLITSSNVRDGWTGTGNIDADPLFQNPATGNYELQSTSPCKNVGENAGLPLDVGDLDWDGNTTEALPMDLARHGRVRWGTVDMGAYELGCQAASTDCDQNGFVDACEIEADPTLDCHNQNGVLDLCETNGVPKWACCVGFTCTYPTTSCRCVASGGVWYLKKTCNQVTCGYSEN